MQKGQKKGHQCPKGKHHRPHNRATSPGILPSTQHPGSVFSVPFRDGDTVTDKWSSREPGVGGLRAFRKSPVLPLVTVDTLDGVHEKTLCMHSCTLSCFSRVQLFVTLWTLARQAPLSMGCSRQEYWSGLPCPPPGYLPDPEIKPMSAALRADPLPLSHSEAPGSEVDRPEQMGLETQVSSLN